MKRFLLLFTVLYFAVGASAQNQPSVAWIHKATSKNITNAYTVIDSDTLNGESDLTPLYVHSYNYKGGTGKYVETKQGLWYFGGQWRVFNQDESDLKENTYYNLLKPGDDMESWVHTTVVGNTFINQTEISHPSIDQNPDAIILVSDKWKGKYNNNYYGVYYNNAEKMWRIFNQGGLTEAMKTDLHFHVAVTKPNAEYKAFVVKSHKGNTSSHILKLDHPDLNYNPEALVFITPIYNPSGEGGVYNDHPTGVYYNGSRWCIYNEDRVAFPANAAFNVVAFPNNQTTSISNQINSTDVKIFPNPASTDESLYVSLEQQMDGPIELNIYSVTGENVFSRNFSNVQDMTGQGISLNNLNRGMYLVKVRSNGKTGIQKLIIN